MWKAAGLSLSHVLLLALLQQLIGLLWYSPWMFAYKWLYLSGLSPLSILRNQYWPFIVSYIASMVMVYIMAWLFARAKITQLGEALVLVFLMWLAFLFCSVLSHAVFEQTSLVLLAVNLGKDLLVHLITAVALLYCVKLGGVK